MQTLGPQASTADAPLELESSAFELLMEILAQPTAPYREAHVVRVVTQALDRVKVPYFADSVGNLVVGAGSLKEYRTLLSGRGAGSAKNEPLRIFIAHLDHPGFHGVEWAATEPAPGRLKARWLGGTPTQHLEGARVWLANTDGWVGHGRIRQPELHPRGIMLQSSEIELESDAAGADRLDPTQLFGGFAFRAPAWREGDLVYTKAADDLVGVFAIAQMAISARKSKLPYVGLLTRAEEVGFIGAIGHFELGLLQAAKRPVVCVSLESSRTLPGAEIGKGPVVRLGDRATTFDPDGLKVLTDLAAKTLPDRHQRRIMDGGRCEATAATAYGLRAIGMSIPLGNYHNQSFEGGPDARGPQGFGGPDAVGSRGPAPEFVHLGDVAGMLRLCRALLSPRLPWKAPWATEVAVFRREYKAARRLLRD